jgi:formyltetrahydrofolate-dependent phosphoribosylglycinamide formyltransferase
MTRIAVLISGFGSNLQAIIDAALTGKLPGVEIAVVVSNRKAAYGLQRAKDANVPTEYFPLKPYRDAGRSRKEYDADLAALLCERYGAEWVVQAGWMHLFSMAFLRRFPKRVVNLHPALLGPFPGMHAIARAWEAYQRGEIDHTGVTIHLVPDEGVDDGPLIAQVPVPIYPNDTLDNLEARVHEIEHRLLVEALHDLLCT